MIRRLFFQQLGHAKYSKNLIEYEITKLENDEDVPKVLVESNYWKRFCPIEILVIFNLFKYYNLSVNYSDCTILKTMMDNNVSVVVSFDSDFDKINGIRRIYL